MGTNEEKAQLVLIANMKIGSTYMCDKCYAVWTNVGLITVDGSNLYKHCPNCGRSVMIDPDKNDYILKVAIGENKK